jgi:hypothetical protein
MTVRTLEPKFCPFCGAKSIKFVHLVPRCTSCRAVFLVDFFRYARKSPKRKVATAPAEEQL